MKYIVMLFILLVAIYTFSFAKNQWDKKNKMGAVGTILLAIASVAAPAILIFVRQ